MKRKETGKRLYRTVWQVGITLFALFSFAYVWQSRLNTLLYNRYENKGNILMYGVYMVLAIYLLRMFGGYKIGVSRKTNLLISQAVALVCLNGMEIVLTILMVGRVRHIQKIVLGYGKLCVIQMAVIGVISILGANLYRRIFPPYHMLQIYGTYENELPSKMNARRDKYVIARAISYEEDLEVIAEAIREYDAVLINDVPSEKRNRILKCCFEQDKRVYFTPKISDILIKGSDDLNLFDTPLYLCRNLGPSRMYQAAKRGLDVFFALLGILVTSPIMALTAAAIYLYDRGPVLYRQTRCTVGGKEFQICKFRSMIVNAEKDGKARLASKNDSRITPVGKFIRATRIDELPQFFNILAGDMSFVGPRPERPQIIRKYCKEIPEFAYRTKVKAGLTGYAQIYGKYNTTSYDKLKLDLMYISKCSLLLDFKLLFLTLKIVFIKESTEGVSK